MIIPFTNIYLLVEVCGHQRQVIHAALSLEGAMGPVDRAYGASQVRPMQVAHGKWLVELNDTIDTPFSYYAVRIPTGGA
jgi:hypothetical protein